MRVSTAQFYYQNSQQLTEKQSDVNEQTNYIASGKRVLTAKDDAVAYGTLAGYKDELANLEKYKRNITQAENRNSLQETSFANAENLLQNLKTLFIQANNGTLSADDLTALAELAESDLEQMIDISNTKDETGGYIFAGYQIDTEPFSRQPDNTVTYNGDNGVRELQIAKNILVATNQPGDEAFEAINHQGDFVATYNTSVSGIALNTAIITDRGAYDPVASPPDYNFNFTSATDLTVTDAGGAVVYTTATYTAGQNIAFNGIEVQLNGNPLPGDDFNITPQDKVSVFETMKASIDWMNGAITTPGSTEHMVEYNEVISQLDFALNHIVTRRTDAGVRLQLVDTQRNNHLDAELYLAQGQSDIEDLDFAKAISDFEQSKVALQAAQQTFVQVKDLSLFNYI